MTTAVQEKENKKIARAYKELLRIAYQTLSDTDKKMIRAAFDLAVTAHKEQRRKSGEPYIFHPIAVARIVSKEIGLGATSICAALLHDVVEDTGYSLEDIKRRFGKTVARIVDGLTKISTLKKEQDISIQAENFRKMLLTLNDDARVILIKIADRLHNMQTMESVPRHKQLKTASETLYIYAPLAHRLGLYNIKTELEDLGLKYTEPEVYMDILNKINESSEAQKSYIEEFSGVLKNALSKEKLKYRIKGRSKSIFSIRNKMLKQGVSFDEVYDKFAIRIIYESDLKNEKFFAWKIYSIVTDHFQPGPNRLRDWISTPKSTGYEALHITVMGPKGRWVEVQIRSERMDEIAEKGYAAHYKYKHGEDGESSLEMWLNRLKETLENPEINAIDFVEEFKMNLYAKEIFVFTPKGDLKPLPKGATALDFAFSIHTEVGTHCRGARVNGKIVPLNRPLNSGDQVEIITSPSQKPKAGWLDFVVTARARSRIKNALREEQKRIAEDGKELLMRKLRHLKVTLNEKTVNELTRFFKLKTSLDLFYRVGIGSINNQQLKDFVAHKNNVLLNFFRNKMRRTSTETETHHTDEEVTSKFDLLVFGNEEERLDYKLANCCNPIPGDKVFGFVTVNEGIKIHKEDCPNAISLQSNYSYRIIPAKWIDSSQQEFKAIIHMKGIDGIGLVSKITKVISNNMLVNIQSINIRGEAGFFDGKFTVVVKNQTQLMRLMNLLRKIEGIEEVERIYKNE